MSGGGGGNTTTTQKADPWKHLQPYLLGGETTGKFGGPVQDVQGAFPWFSSAAQNVPEFYPGQTYAGFNPYQISGFNQALGAAGGMYPTLGAAQGALNYGLTSAYDPANNPVVQRYAEAAIRPVTEMYQEQVLPGITDAAVASGGLGGSRQGVAEGIAAGRYMDTVGDVTANIYNAAYGQGLDQQARMMSLLPSTMNTMLMPSQVYGQVGGAYQGMDQQAINEAMNRYYYNQDAEYQRAKDYLNVLQGTPWGSSSVTGPNPNAQSPAGQIAGAGMMGLGTYGMLAMNPATAPFAIPAGVAMGALGLL